jgi:hypothetical protein
MFRKNLHRYDLGFFRDNNNIRTAGKVHVYVKPPKVLSNQLNFNNTAHRNTSTVVVNIIIFMNTGIWCGRFLSVSTYLRKLTNITNNNTAHIWKLRLLLFVWNMVQVPYLNLFQFYT